MIVLPVVGLLEPPLSATQPTPPNPAHSTIKPPDQARPYAPGVRINWLRRVVEVDARVVLREGPLELLACSPHTREHESILAVQARPLHIFQAMGLIGLEPGSPVRYDDKNDRLYPPTGEALELRVRCQSPDPTQTVPVKNWLLDVAKNHPPRQLNWVFSGSRRLKKGGIGADEEGTVACVVDFETALISVGALHSADNELLWLAANREAIPPIGTMCRLLIAPAFKKTVEVVLTPDGTFRFMGKEVSLTDLIRTAHLGGSDAGRIRVVLRAGSSLSAKVVETAMDAMIRAGIDRTSIEVHEPQTDRPRKGPNPK